ncbi:MAG: hypothetical protein J6L60_07235 [Bacteroidaceae bacterium]|nr:hypothetical protein [Bacteroidaceae bacterium]
MKRVSIDERKQFRICKMQKRKKAKTQKHKIIKTQNYKNAKTQKSKNAKKQKRKKAKTQKYKKAKLRVSERNETCLIAERKQFRICKMQKRKKVLNQFSQLTKENAHILQRINEGGESGHRAALPLHSPSAMGRQKKWPPITAAIYPMY